MKRRIVIQLLGVLAASPRAALAQRKAGSVPVIGYLAGNLPAMMPQLAGKRLELLKEIIPGLARVAFLLAGNDPSHRIFAKEAEDAGKALGIQLQRVVIDDASHLEGAFASMQKEKTQAVIVQPIFVNVLGLGPQITQMAVKNKLPAIGDSDVFADVGGLVFYGPDLLSMYERVAVYADRVLKGAKPADLPVEQPHKFQLIFNLKTAKALGITIPRAVLVRADRVIE